jgi:Domain of unknown function (DUF4826)
MNETPKTGVHPRAAGAEAWVREAMREVCVRMVSAGHIGADLKWEVPWGLLGRCLIARVWSAGEPENAWWAVTGDLPFDAIPAAVAINPREAARHFALRWQLEAARMEGLATNPGGEGAAAPPTEGGRVDWNAAAARLVRNAERLYAIVARDDLWPQTPQIIAFADDSRPT